jgi:integrase
VQENNARQVFFEPEHYQSVLKYLLEELRPVVTFAYITGWRMKSEVLALEWRQVDPKAGGVRLEPGTTKNNDGRTFPFTKTLRTLLEAQHANCEHLKKRGKIVPWVFLRMVANGRASRCNRNRPSRLARRSRPPAAKPAAQAGFSMISDGVR